MVIPPTIQETMRLIKLWQLTHNGEIPSPQIIAKQREMSESRIYDQYAWLRKSGFLPPNTNKGWKHNAKHTRLSLKAWHKWKQIADELKAKGWGD